MKKKPFSKVSKALYASLVLFTPFTAANANTLGADSVYTFTPVSAEANNVIKQAVYNSADNSVTYNYSRLDLTNPDRDNTNHFGSGSNSKDYSIDGISAVANWSNSSYANHSGASGVIDNSGNYSGSITGDFVNNFTSNQGAAVRVGMLNSGNGSLIGNFIGNSCSSDISTSYPAGGAFNLTGNYTGQRVKEISGNFIGNYVTSNTRAISGGAIQTTGSGNASSYSSIGAINANFIGNYVETKATGNTGYSQGGAIDNGQYAKIGDITGDFIRNHASSSSKSNTRGSQGGAIYTFATSQLGNITGDFIENYVKGEGVGAGAGGALYINARTPVGNIKGNFYSNYAQGVSSAEGGAILNFGQMSDIGDKDCIFNNNHVIVTATSGNLIARGSVIANAFDTRTSAAWNPNGLGASIKNISGRFTGNYIDAVAANAEGGVIYNHAKSTITSITNAIFEGSKVTAKTTKGGVIYNDGTITNGISNSSFVGNKSGAGDGGAIYNTGNLGVISNTEFKNNALTSGRGGAIYTTKDIVLQDNVVFQNNYATSGKDIYLANGANLTVKNTDDNTYDTTSTSGIASADNASKIIVDEGAHLTLSGDDTGFLGITTLKDNAILSFRGSDSITNVELDGENSYISYDWVEDNKLTNLSALDNSSTSIVKSGSGKLTLNGDVSKADANVAVNSGVVEHIGQYFKSSNNTINKSSELIINNSNDIIASLTCGSFGSGIFTKQGNGILTLDGQNSGFTGVINLNNGKISYTSGEGKSFLNAQTYNIAQNTILEITNNDTDNIDLNEIVGSGIISKSGDADLSFNSDKSEGSGFVGKLSANGGKTVANVGAQNAEGQLDFEAELGGDAQLEYNNAATDKFTFNNTSKLSFAEGANDADITFNRADFTLAGDVKNASGNTITMGAGSNVEITGANYAGNYSILDGSKVNLSTQADTNFSGNVAIKNSSLNLQNGTVTDTTFNSLNLGTKTDLTLDLAFGDNITSDTISADTSNGQFNLKDVNVAISRVDRNILNETVKVLTGVTFTDDTYSKSIFDNSLAYSYTMEKVGPDSLKFTSSQKYNSLYILNHLRDAERTFAWNEKDYNTYYVNTDETDGTLGQTLAGTLHVLGRSKDRADIIHASSLAATERFSLFDLSNAVNLDIQDITIRQAGGKNGSVVNVTSSDASVNVDNVLFSNSESVVFVGENTGKTEGKEIVISNSRFQGNTIAQGAQSSAIHNEGKVTLNDVEFSGNQGTYIYNKGELNITSTKDETARLVNGTDGNIINDGVINIDAGEELEFDIANSISTTDNSVGNGTIITKGNYIIGGKLTNQNITSSNGKTLITGGLVNSNWTITDTSSGILTSNVAGGSVINNNVLNITSPISVSGDILSDANSGHSINYTGSGNLDITGNVNNYKGVFNINNPDMERKEGVVNFTERNNINNFFTADTQINNYSGILNYDTDKTNLSLSSAGNFAKMNLNNGATFNMTGVEDGKYVIGDGWLTTAGSNNINLTNGEYLFNTILPKTANTVTIANATFGFNDIDGTPNGNLNGYDFNIGNNYVLKDGSTLDLLMHVHNNASGENPAHYAGDNYIFDSLNSFGDNNNISLDLNLYADYSRFPITDTITANSGSGILNLVKVGIRDDNGGIFTYNKPLRVIFGNNNLQIATENHIDVLSWATNVYKYKFKSDTSVGVEGLEDEYSHTADSVSVEYGGFSSSETLRDLNRFNINLSDDNQGGNRGFSFVENQDYHIYRDLDETTKGHFVLVGKSEKTPNGGVISGAFNELKFESTTETDRFFEKDGKYYYTEYLKGVEEAVPREVQVHMETIDGKEYYVIDYTEFTPHRAYGSMFMLVNDTQFDMTDITLKDTMRAGVKDVKDGSAIYANNATAYARLGNVNFENNRVMAGNGGAIANILSDEFVLKGSKITDNYASANGGSIYNTSNGMILENLTADNNSAGGKGGVIYTNKDLIIRNSNFGTAEINSQDNGANDIYIDGDATVTFNTDDIAQTEDTPAKSGDSVINSGIAGSGNFVKDGNAKLTLSGVNNDLTGRFEVVHGNVDYNQTVADSFVSGEVKLAKDTTLNINNADSDHVQNLSGEGTLNKFGAGDIALTGDNKAFTGALNINNGNLNYTQNVENGFVNGKVKLAQGTIFNYANNSDDHIKNLLGEGTLNKNGAGDIKLTGDNSKFIGDANINEGSLTYVYNPESSDKYFGGNTVLDNAVLNVDVVSGSTEIKNISSKNTNSGRLVKKGTGNAALTGDNSGFTGETDIQGGILAYSNASGKFVKGDVNISEDAQLEYTTAADDNITNKVSGLGRFTKKGSGRLNLNNNNSEFNGIVDVISGKLAYSDSVAGAKFFGENTTYNVDGEFDIANNNDIALKDLSGNGKVVKSESGTLNLVGDNSKYTGSIKVNSGDLSFTHNDNNEYISGSTELAQDAVLNYTADKDSVLENVSGNGTLNYSGSQKLTFDTNESDFTGTANVDGKELNVIGKNSSTADFEMNVNSGKLNYTAASDANILIDNKFKFAQGNNSTIQFNGAGFTLNDEITNSSGNNVIFNDTTIAFNNSQYEQGEYTIQDSIIDLTQDNHKTYNREFNNLTVGENTGLKLDVDLLLKEGAKDAKADTLKVKNSDAGAIKVALTQIHVNDKKSDDGLGQTYTINVLDGLTFDEEKSIGRWATQAYTYDVKTKDKDLELTAVKASDGNSLGEMNRLDGTRGFNFNFTKEDDPTYKITSNLGDTNAGKFAVLGDKDRGTVITGDKKYSMFNVTKATELTVSDVTIKDAKVTDRGGAVVLANNENAKVLLDNVNISSSDSSKNGGAISNIKSKEFNILGGEIQGNKSRADGGAIYTSSNMNIFETNFANNTDKNGKNDIYISGKSTNVNYEVSTGNNGNISSGIAGDGVFNKIGEGTLNLSGRNIGFNGTMNILNGSEVKFSQSSKDDSYISGTTNLGANSKLTLNNDKSNINIGSISGQAGTAVDITGGKKVTLGRDNSGFSGDLNIIKGSAAFNSYSANDKYISGKTNISKDASLNLHNTNDFYLNDKIFGEGKLTKSGDGRLIVNGINNLTGEMAITQGELAFKQNSSLGDLNMLTMNDATTMNLKNTTLIRNNDGTFTTSPNPASLENVYVKNIVINGKVNLKLDVDLKEEKADKIGAEYALGDGQFVINRDGINVVSDSLLDNTSVEIAYGALASGDRIALDKNANTVMGPIQKYSVSYGNGYLDFTKMGGNTPSYDVVNPSVMAAPVAAQVGGYLTQLETLQSGFYHMDRYMKYARNTRLSAEQVNRYAINEKPVYSRSPLPETSQAMWVKPYVSFEKVNLQGGPNVSNTTYGTLYGGDSDLYDLKHGFKGVVSAFVGYNGSRQSYSGISMNQNGGTLGITGTLYRNNFFTGLTISTGASAGDAYTTFGRDDFTMLTAGIASKTGYNWEIKEGKFIVQPSLFLGYTFVNTFDYRNKANLSINSDALHAIQIMPGIKFIGNLKNNTQVYAATDVVASVLGDTNVKANDVTLPQLSVKPYVQYGVGVQKMWSDKFTAFFQAMVRNGGRNGIAFTTGFRWALGKAKMEKDDAVVPVKRVIKELL